MTVLAGITALVMAAALGYCMGRRQSVSPPAWWRRTSRIVIGGLAVNLFMAVAARRVRRSPVATIATSVLARVRT